MDTKYNFPPLDLLSDKMILSDETDTFYQMEKNTIEDFFDRYKIKVNVINRIINLNVLIYEFVASGDVNEKELLWYEEELRLALRLDKPPVIMPSKESNSYLMFIFKKHNMILMKELLADKVFTENPYKDYFIVGIGMEQKNIFSRLNSPMMITGVSGGGKTMFINSIILSILYHTSPDEHRIMIVDSKDSEYLKYRGLPNLLTEEIISDGKTFMSAINYFEEEYLSRKSIIKDGGYDTIEEYNQYKDNDLPIYTMIIDGLNLLVTDENVNAINEFLILSTDMSKYGLNVIFTTCNSHEFTDRGINFLISPTASFKSLEEISVRSEGILGAHNLSGAGDMLYNDGNSILRVQCGHITDEDIIKVVDYLKENNTADYSKEIAEKIFNIK